MIKEKDDYGPIRTMRWRSNGVVGDIMVIGGKGAILN